MLVVPTRVGSGVDAYYSNGDRSSWVLPAADVDAWLESLSRRQQESNEEIDGTAEQQNSNLSAGVASPPGTRTKVASRPASRTNDKAWVVKIHSDTGQVFYQNKEGDECAWFNPLSASGVKRADLSPSLNMLDEEQINPVAKIFADNWVEWDDRKDEELEHVAGFTLLVDAKARFQYETGELYAALSRLERWLGRRQLTVSEADTLALKWAEYANTERHFNAQERIEVHVNVEDYPQLPQREVRISCDLSTTVRELHEQLFLRTYKTLDNGTICIDPNWIKPEMDTRNPLMARRGVTGGRDEDPLEGLNSETYEKYVYKVVGCTDYLIHQSFRLGFFDHINTCTARRMRIELALIKLSEGDALDLQSRVREPLSTARVAMRSGNGSTDDDDFRLDRDEDARARETNEVEQLSSFPRAANHQKPVLRRASVGAMTPWSSKQFFAMEEINWSFRCMVRGISKLTETIPTEFLQKYLGSDAAANDDGDPEAFKTYSASGWLVVVQVAICNGGIALKGDKNGAGGSGGGGGGLCGGGMMDGGGMGSEGSGERLSHPDHPDWDHAAGPSAMLFSNGGFDQEWPLEWVDPLAQPAGGGVGHSPIKVRNLPYASRVCFRVVLQKKGASSIKANKNSVPIAGVSLPMINFRRELITGKVKAYLWPSEELQKFRDSDIMQGEKDPQFLQLESRPVGENPERNTGAIHLIFDSYELPVLAQRPCYNDYRDRLKSPTQTDVQLPPSMPPSSDEGRYLDTIEYKWSPLRSLERRDRELLFKCRDTVAHRPGLLGRFVEAVDWEDPRQVDEGRMVLARAEEHVRANRDEIACLQLMDIKYGDPVVREFAVRQLDRLDDCSLAEVFLQLTQVLKYEHEHDTPLARFLLRRAIRNPLRIGQQFFWMLRSEMHLHSINDRYGLLLKIYLQRCGPHKTMLSRQLFINDSLTSIAQRVHKVKIKKAEAYNNFIQKELEKLVLPAKFSLCHAPRVELTGIVVRKCEVMTSKKLPLRLDFVNADPHFKGYYRALFKCGDDLRQDLLTLQVLSVMERWWNESGRSARMIPYACSSAGDQLGFIEWVTESTTTAWVQTKYGGTYGALRKENMRQHIAKYNSSSDFATATMDFIHSCASYCVATYVLGIGDRHSDNIMVKQNGMLFHIDFGHFLGNFKSKMGVKRERDKFVFTLDFLYVMGGATRTIAGTVREGDDRNLYKAFCEECGNAYNTLRMNKNLLMNLFVLMIPAGMPELTKRSDIEFIERMLMLEKSNEEATRHYKDEIGNALATISRRLDNLAHTMKHSGK